jgi:hypothetical protein
MRMAAFPAWLVVVGLLAAGLLLFAGEAFAEDPTVTARNLAEGILGKGLVRSSRLVDSGSAIRMVWESATYKRTNPAPHTRELLEAEAQLASGAVLHVLRSVRALQFEIVLGKRSLCTGEASRDRPFRIAYARDLSP